MTLKTLLFLSMLTLFLSGCAGKKGLYYWEDYSNTLYNWRKDATQERAVEHKAELVKVIEKSDEKGVRVPPGVYCEYGYMLLMDGDKEGAVSFFEKEAVAYPESEKFVSFLLKQCQESDVEEVSDDAQNDK